MDYINLGEYWYCMNRIAWWLVRNNKQFKKRNLYGFDGKAVDLHTMETAIRDRGDNVALDGMVAEYVECAIFDNTDLSFLPAHVTCSDGLTKLYLNSYVDMANRVSAYEVLNGKSPKIVYIKKENTTNTKVDSTLQAFINAFGNVTCIDDCLEKIQGRGYGYYYNSQYNTQTTINRIKNRQGVNCTDSSQLFYRLGIALGYEVQFVHVKCRGGDGHIRLRLRKSGINNGNWFYKDPAAVLDGESINSNWCMNGTIIAYNPSWIFSDLYQ